MWVRNRGTNPYNPNPNPNPNRNPPFPSSDHNTLIYILLDTLAKPSQAVTPDQILTVEALVNRWIADGTDVDTQVSITITITSLYFLSLGCDNPHPNLDLPNPIYGWMDNPIYLS